MRHVKKVRPKVYLSNKDLYCELVYSRAKGKLTKPAESMLILLGKNIIKKFYYQNPDDKHDCIQNGYIQLFSNWYSFDENKGNNAFAWATEVFKRGAAAGWNKLHRTKGEQVEFISLTGYDENGNSYDRF
jgi:hypothetical protein